jgi:hypothetical protein
MPGNLSSKQARERLAERGVAPRGLGLEEAAAYIGISPHLFLQEVSAGRLPKPRQYGRRKVWDRVALDRSFEDDAASTAQDPDPIMATINAARSAKVC